MANIQRYTVASGKRYRLHWRDPSGKQHGKVFKRSDIQSDARIETVFGNGLRRGDLTLQAESARLIFGFNTLDGPLYWEADFDITVPLGN